MKIAFVQYMAPNLPPNMVSDYQMDMLYHGLVKTYGQTKIHPFVYPWWMYANEKEQRPEDFKKIWGKGFTVYGTLDKSSEIELCTVDKLAGRQYDLVVVGMHHSTISNYENQKLTGLQDLILQLRNYYDPSCIAIIDGWDRPYIDRDIAKLATYFKRELYPEYEDCDYPISFAIPEEKICRDYNTPYKYDIAPLIPVNESIDSSYRKTYIYDNEVDYYDMYKSSMFALTSCKGGWDTARHYEIIANNCIPIFVDIENCPDKTLFRFPKELCKKVKKLPFLYLNLKGNDMFWYPGATLSNCACINMDNPGFVDRPTDAKQSIKTCELLAHLQSQFIDWLYKEGATLALAKYLVDTTLGQPAREARKLLV
jgi:hypothetical protein